MKINIQYTTRDDTAQRPATRFHDIVSLWVGVGYIGHRKQVRRFLQTRDNYGRIKYFFWTEPRKGEFIFAIFRFRRVKKITLEQAKKHYEK
jgi:hypothetical protein